MPHFKTLSFLLFVLSFCGCMHQKTVQEKKPTVIVFEHFSSSDLSEDQAHLSTQEDEIIVVYGEITIDSSQTISTVLLYNSGIVSVTKGSTHQLAKTHYISSKAEGKSIVFIGLVEIDEQVTAKKLRQYFASNLLNKNILEVNTVWESSINEVSKFNDNLGIVLQRPSIGLQTYRISGTQLTDRYEYYFSVDVN